MFQGVFRTLDILNMAMLGLYCTEYVVLEFWNRMVQASQTRTLSHGGRVVEICIKDDIVAHGFTVVRRALSNTATNVTIMKRRTFLTTSKFFGKNYIF